METHSHSRMFLHGFGISVGLYLAAMAAVLAVAKLAPQVAAAQLAAGVAMAVATVAPAWLIPNPAYPRRTMITAGVILAAGLLLPALFMPDLATWSHQTLLSGGNGWLYMFLLAVTPAPKSGWCAPPWLPVAVAVLLSAVTFAASVWL